MKNRNIRLFFDRLINGGSTKQIFTLLAITFGAFVLVGGLCALIFSSHIGFTEKVDSTEEYRSFWQLYYYFADPGNQMSMDGKADYSRIIGLVMSTLGSVFLGGLLISTITNTIQRRVDKCRDGRTYYKFSDHAVVIGSDQMVLGIVRQLLGTDVNHIVILTSSNADALRQTIYAALPNKEARKRVIVNYGNRDSEDFLEKVRITKAREVYIIGDNSEFDDIENFHDSLNIECLKHIAKLCKKANRKGLPCNVAFDTKTTFHVFQYADLPAEDSEYIDFHPFNFNEFWAQKVLVAGCSPDCGIEYRPLDYRPITSPTSDDFVHLIVIGFSPMGQAIALQAAHIAHFPNHRRRKTRITVIDSNMRELMDEFKLKCGSLFDVSKSEFIDADKWVETGTKEVVQYGINDAVFGHLVEGYSDKEFIDVEWTFIKGDDGNPKVRQLLHEYAENQNAITTVAVCLNISHRSLRSAMFLPKIFYENEVPILVHQRKTETFVNTLNGKTLDAASRERLKYKNLSPFGMVYDCYDIRLALSIKYSKRINAVYDYFFAHKKPAEKINDEKANNLWKQLQTPKKWSNVFAAASIPTKLRCLGYTESDLRDPTFRVPKLTEQQIEMLADMEHNRWNVEELLLGFRPVTAEEDSQIDAQKSLKKHFKARYIHYDIRPTEQLKTDDQGVRALDYDRLLVSSIPLIVNP